jgi:RimJ/RimL family protein N-acetyltransferase
MIETERLLLKPLTADELKRQVEAPELFALELGLKPSSSLVDDEAIEAILNDLLPNLSDPDKDPCFYTMWIIICKKEQAITGGICFHGEPNENGEVEIGYGTDDGYRNKGFMTETIAGLVTWLRTKPDIKAIIAETTDDNEASVRVLQKNGFTILKKDNHSLLLRLQL